MISALLPFGHLHLGLDQRADGRIAWFLSPRLSGAPLVEGLTGAPCLLADLQNAQAAVRQMGGGLRFFDVDERNASCP